MKNINIQMLPIDLHCILFQFPLRSFERERLRKNKRKVMRKYRGPSSLAKNSRLLTKLDRTFALQVVILRWMTC